MRSLLGIFRAGLYLVFLAAALRAFPQTIPVISYPIFWEVIAGLVLLVSGLMLLSFSFTRTKLARQTARQFLDFNHNVIVTGTEDEVRELGHEIRESLDLVAKQCAAWSQRRDRTGISERRSDHARDRSAPSDLQRVSFTLLEVWADPRFANALVCWCPGTAIEFFRTFSKHRVMDATYALTSELVHQAIADPRSIGHRESGYFGLGRHKAFMRSVFGDVHVLASRANPLDAWRVHMDPEITHEKVRLWGEAIEIALETCIQKRDTWRSGFAIRQGLEKVGSAFMYAANQAKGGESNTARRPPLMAMGSIFEECINQVARADILYEDDEATVDGYDELKDNAIHGHIAREFFDYCGNVLAHTDGWSDIHSATIQPWMALFPTSDAQVSRELKALQVRFAHHVKRKLDENFDPKKAYYPSAIKLMLVHYGLHAPRHTTTCIVEYRLAEHFHERLVKDFAALWCWNEKFARAMLPSDVEYDPDTRVLKHHRFERRAEPEMLKLAPPP